MKRLARHVLVWMLAIALVAGGLPIAHAASCADSHSRNHAMTAQHGHAAADVEAVSASAADHAHDAHGLSHNAPAKDAAMFCKCLNCSNLCAAFVAPLQAAITVARRVGAIAYRSPRTFENDVPPHVDPGIPIVA